MFTVTLDRKTGEVTLKARLNPDSFHASSSGKSTLLLEGQETQVSGDAGIRGNVSLYVKDVDALGLEP